MNNVLSLNYRVKDCLKQQELVHVLVARVLSTFLFHMIFFILSLRRKELLQNLWGRCEGLLLLLLAFDYACSSNALYALDITLKACEIDRITSLRGSSLPPFEQIDSLMPTTRKNYLDTNFRYQIK